MLCSRRETSTTSHNKGQLIMSRSIYTSVPRQQQDQQSYDLYDRSSALLHKDKWVLYGTRESDAVDLLKVEETVLQAPGSETNGFIYYAGAGDDKVKGSSKDDRMYGQYGNDVLDGFVGDDYMSGGYGDDILRGSYGSDTMIGGHGDDVLDGGGGWGADLFILDGLGQDVVKGVGFSSSINPGQEGDKILINQSNWTCQIVGNDIVVMDNQLNPFAVIQSNDSSLVRLERRTDGFIVVDEIWGGQAQQVGFEFVN